jgi:hypothetical protein
MNTEFGLGDLLENARFPNQEEIERITLKLVVAK